MIYNSTFHQSKPRKSFSLRARVKTAFVNYSSSTILVINVYLFVLGGFQCNCLGYFCLAQGDTGSHLLDIIEHVALLP